MGKRAPEGADVERSDSEVPEVTEDAPLSVKARWWWSFYTVFVIGYLVCFLYYGIRDPKWLFVFTEGALFLYALPKVVKYYHKTRQETYAFTKKTQEIENELKRLRDGEGG